MPVLLPKLRRMFINEVMQVKGIALEKCLTVSKISPAFKLDLFSKAEFQPMLHKSSLPQFLMIQVII